MKTVRTQQQGRLLSTALLAALLVAGSAVVSAADEPAMMRDGMLVGNNGMTLYTFDKDAEGKSMCYGQCASNWPPLLAEEGAIAGGDYGVIRREDGKMQYTYEGKPLYYWSKDMKPGDTMGDGMGGMWHTVK